MVDMTEDEKRWRNITRENLPTGITTDDYDDDNMSST